MLTIEQLEAAKAACISLGLCNDNDREREHWADLAAAFDEEIDRRAFGPFTLAEAVASGKPFRRKGWDCFDGEWFVVIPHGDVAWLSAVGGEIGNGGPLQIDDITADDFELMPEGGK